MALIAVQDVNKLTIILIRIYCLDTFIYRAAFFGPPSGSAAGDNYGNCTLKNRRETEYLNNEKTRTRVVVVFAARTKRELLRNEKTTTKIDLLIYCYYKYMW